jgi:hypothetical protein
MRHLPKLPVMLTHAAMHLHCICCNCVLQQLAILEAIESASLTHFKNDILMFFELDCWNRTVLNVALGLILASPGFMRMFLPRPAHTPKCQSGIIPDR